MTRVYLSLILLALWAQCSAGQEAMFHRIFVTGSAYGVGAGGFLGPNARSFADYEATFAAWDAGWLPSWNGTDIVYTAFLSDSGAEFPNANDRINLVGPVINSRREVVWRDPSNYLNADPENTWGLTEYGSEVPSSKLWTGSEPGGSIGSDCGGWTNPLGAGTHGRLESLSFGGSDTGCQGGGHFVAFGPPEPLSSLAPGLTLLNPIVADVAGPEEWTFTEATNHSWYDLPLADQLKLTASGGEPFTKAILPTGFKSSGGSPLAAFEVLVGEESLGLFAGSEPIDFITLTGEAVFEFTVRGIGAATPPTGSDNFPISLSFNAPMANFKVTPAGLPPSADFDGDGSVGADDLVAWSDGFGRVGDAVLGDGDADGDLDVDGADFLLWQRQLEANNISTQVPEPGTILLFVTIVLARLVINTSRRRSVNLLNLSAASSDY